MNADQYQTRVSEVLSLAKEIRFIRALRQLNYGSANMHFGWKQEQCSGLILKNTVEFVCAPITADKFTEA